MRALFCAVPPQLMFACQGQMDCICNDIFEMTELIVTGMKAEAVRDEKHFLATENIALCKHKTI